MIERKAKPDPEKENGSGSPSGGPDEGRYRPIADYALIGDCHGAALVSRAGGIDWATLRRFDADPVFCRLLDAGRGGHWSIRPEGEFTVTRAYLPDTNILRTEFRTPSGGRVAVTDCMPVGRTLDARTHDYVDLNAPGWITRRVEGLEGEVTLAVEYRPSLEFAREAVTLSLAEGRVETSGPGPTLHGNLDFRVEGDTARARVTVRAGDVGDHVLASTRVEGASPCERVGEFLDVTRAFWEEWLGYCRYEGPHEGAMRRSALVLKALTYAPTGAIVAAPTTSLPEDIGGIRNWDYRYCWVRDASFALYALAVLGYSGEVRRFHEFLSRASTASLPDVQPMYGIDGALALGESELEHLEGYRGSAPVHVGNGAWNQRQIDNYGHMLDLALVYTRLDGELDAQYRRLLDAVARFVEAHWEEPDESLWEMRGEPRHHTHARLMSWVGDGPGGAAPRRGALASGGRSRPPHHRCRGARGCAGSSRATRAAPTPRRCSCRCSATPPPRTPSRRRSTTVKSELGRGRDLLLRYAGDDGLEGEEGAFLLCGSWLADAELAVGRVEEARARIERFVDRANDVGLYAEEIDPDGGEFLGNSPQAFTHLGLIGNLVNLSLVEVHGPEGLAGGYAERAERAVSRVVRLARHSRRDRPVEAGGSDHVVRRVEARLALRIGARPGGRFIAERCSPRSGIPMQRERIVSSVALASAWRDNCRTSVVNKTFRTITRAHFNRYRYPPRSRARRSCWIPWPSRPSSTPTRSISVTSPRFSISTPATSRRRRTTDGPPT